MRKSIVKFVLFVSIILAFFWASRYSGLGGYFHLSELPDRVDMYGAWAPLAFIGLYVAAAVLFLPSTPFTILSGVLFGPFYGGLYAMAGAMAGAVMAFVFARYLGRGLVGSYAKNRFQKIFELDEYLRKNGFAAVFTLRLFPFFPFNGLNLSFGLSGVLFKEYFWGTFFGIMPFAFVYAIFGSLLADLHAWTIVLAIILMLAFFGIRILAFFAGGQMLGFQKFQPKRLSAQSASLGSAVEFVKRIYDFCIEFINSRTKP